MSQQSPDQFFQSAGISQFTPGQGPAQYGQAAYQAAGANPAAAAIAQAQGPNYRATNALANTLGAAVGGAGPSAAQAQLASATGATLGNLAGVAAATGPNNMAARQGLLNSGASALAAGGNASAQTRAQESQAAQGQLSGLLGTQTAQQQALALGNAGMTNTGNMFNAGQSNAVGLANAAAQNQALAMGSQFANSNFQEGQQLSAEQQAQLNQMRYQIQQGNNQATSPGAILGDVGQGLGAIGSLGAAFAKEGGLFVDHPTVMKLHDQAVIPLSDTRETAEKLATPARDLRPDQKPTGGGMPLSKEIAPQVLEALRSATLSPMNSHKILGKNENGTIRVQLCNGGLVDVHPAGMPHYDVGGLSFGQLAGNAGLNTLPGDPQLSSPTLGIAGSLPDDAAAPAGPGANLGLTDADSTPRTLTAVAQAAGPGAGAGMSLGGAMKALGGLSKSIQGAGAGMMPNYGSAPGPQHFQIQHFDEGGTPPPVQDAGTVSEVGEDNKPEAIVPVDADSGGAPPPAPQDPDAIKAQLDQAKTEAGSGQLATAQDDGSFNVATAGTGAAERAAKPVRVPGHGVPTKVDGLMQQFLAANNTQRGLVEDATNEQNKIKAQNASDVVSAYGDVQDATKAAMTAQADQQKQEQAIYAQTMQHMQAIDSQMAQGIHPMTARDYFAHQDTFGKIMTGIGLALGAVSQGTAGMMMAPDQAAAARANAKNPALDYINSAISRDLQTQKDNMDILGKRSDMAGKLYGMASQHFQSQAAASAAAQAMATRLVEMQVNSATAKMGGALASGPAAAAALKAALGEQKLKALGDTVDIQTKEATANGANAKAASDWQDVAEKRFMNKLRIGNPGAFGNPANVVVDPSSGQSFNAGAGVEGKTATPDLSAKWDAVNAAKASMDEAQSHGKMEGFARSVLPWYGSADVGRGAAMRDMQATTRASSEAKGQAPRESMIKALEERTTNPAQAYTDKDRQRLISEYNDRLREYHEAASRYHRG